MPTLALLGNGNPAIADKPAQLDCTPGSTLTPRQTAGPFFTPNTPLKQDFRSDDPGGKPFHLSGRVQTPDCLPIMSAMIELWHADSRGEYDNKGYRMRGHQFSDETGCFEFLTHRPGLYPGRTGHFHITIKTSQGQSLTTQLYFPDEALNARDGIFDSRLLMDVADIEGVTTGYFDFVIA